MAPDTIERISMMKDPALFRQQCYVDGKWTNADSGATHSVVNPATGRVIGTVPVFLREETRRAIEAAERAWPAWRAKTAKERAIVLHPLPRGPELALGLEADPRVACFRQAENGLYVRMALLTLLMRGAGAALNRPEGRQ